MTATSFVDTNVLIYRATPGPEEHRKAEIADEILRQPSLGISVQVLQEFYTQVTRPTRKNQITHEEALDYISKWKRFPIRPMTEDIFDRAIVACQRCKISYWDAAIIEAAREMECREVLSEDLSDQVDYDGIRVMNPFAAR